MATVKDRWGVRDTNDWPFIMGPGNRPDELTGEEIVECAQRIFGTMEKKMPHYKDGTPAAIGDVVRGKGYNVKDAAGNLTEIIGKVVGITPDSTSCNIQVAHVTTEPVGALPANYRLFHQTGVIGCGANGGKDGTPNIGAYVSLEYGQCDAFEKIG